MPAEVKKKQAPKGVRLGWAPLKGVKSVKLELELLKGEKVTEYLTNEHIFRPGNSYLIP